MTNIFNLSSHKFDQSTLTLLERGLLFIPTQNHINVSKYYEGMDRFIRNLKLKDFFRDRVSDKYDLNIKTFVSPSIWEPNVDLIRDSTLKTIETLTEITNSYISAQRVDKFNNIILQEQLNLNNFENLSLKNLLKTE